jgi:hypothetical protein
MYRFIAFGHSHIVAFAKVPRSCRRRRRASGRFLYLYDPSYNPVLQGPAEAPELNSKLREQLTE